VQKEQQKLSFQQAHIFTYRTHTVQDINVTHGKENLTSCSSWSAK